MNSLPPLPSTVISTDHVYFNVNVVNRTNSSIYANYESNFTVPLLSKGSDYTVSILRFFIPGSGIPIFHFPTEENFFIVTVCELDTSDPLNPVPAPPYFSQALVYDPSWNQTIVPNAVWSYLQFLELLNTALAQLLYASAITPPTGIVSFFWDDAKQLFGLNFTNATDKSSYGIFFNNNLFQMFPTFSAKHLTSIFSGPDPKHYLLASYLSSPSMLNPFGYVFYTEDNCQYAWNGLVRLYITSGSLNTRSESQFNASGKNIAIPILTDFEPNVNGDFRVNNVFQYTPTGEYRRVDLANDLPVTKIDFQFIYEDKYGKTYTIVLPPHRFLSLKLLFERKKTC